MPQFSGKMKKEQLKAKRQRKREKEEQNKAQQQQEEDASAADPVSLAEQKQRLIDAEARLRRYHGHHDPQPGAVDDRFAQQRKHTKGRTASVSPSASSSVPSSTSSSGEDDSEHSSEDDARDGKGGAAGPMLPPSAAAAISMPYQRQQRKNATAPPAPAETDGNALLTYGGDRRGVRSQFAKESREDIEARRRLNFAPLQHREMMAPTGIPFGAWFAMPGTATATATTSTTRSNADDATAKPSPTTTTTNTNSVPPIDPAAPALFPLALELPTRGWQPQPQPSSSTLHGEKNTAEGVVPPPVEGKGNVQAQTSEGEMEELPSLKKPAPPPRKAKQHGGEEGADRPRPRGKGRHAKKCVSSSEEEAEVEGVNASEADESDDAPPRNDARAAAIRLEAAEDARFNAYMHAVDHYTVPSPAFAQLPLSSFERNLDVWRQLWRTVEVSDVVVVVTDARYPIVHVSLGMLHYIVKEARKPCVVVLNKADLVPRSTLEGWLSFLPRYLRRVGLIEEEEEKEDGEEKGDAPRPKLPPIVFRAFTALPAGETAIGEDASLNVNKRRGKKERRSKLYEQLRTGKLNVTKDVQSRTGGGGSSGCDEEDSDDDDDDELRYAATENFKGMGKAQRNLQQDRREHKELRVVASMITELLEVCRGLVPQKRTVPDSVKAQMAAVASAEAAKAAKSSPVVAPRRARRKNHKAKKALYGAPASDAVSSEGSDDESSTDRDEDPMHQRAPDHDAYLHIGFVGYPNVGKSSLLNCICGTKVVSVSATPGHTKHLQTIPIPAEGITLVDSPGLALPTLGLPRPLQAVIGTHQIAQTRDPQSGVGYLAAHLPLERLYGLARPEGAVTEDEWSPYEFCEAYATKKGCYVKHGKGALDIHRAAIALLQEAYDGRIVLFFAPPELSYLRSKFFEAHLLPYLWLPVMATSSLPAKERRTEEPVAGEKQS